VKKAVAAGKRDITEKEMENQKNNERNHSTTGGKNLAH
jgi:hypothetical protein